MSWRAFCQLGMAMLVSLVIRGSGVDRRALMGNQTYNPAGAEDDAPTN